MAFNSLEFIIAFVVFVSIYYMIPAKQRNVFILLGSLLFYAYYDLLLSLYLVACICVTYFVGLSIEKRKSDSKSAKYLLIIGISLNLGSLCFFKYVNFLGKTISLFVNSGEYTFLSIAAPLGISFLVFQALSYLVDVYRSDIEAEKSFFIFALYMSFFPKLVQGPIERAKDMLPQFREEHHFDLFSAREGLLKMLYGLFLKVVVADNAGIVVNKIYGSPSSYGGFTILMATFVFAIQIYCDFAGYTLMAKGSAEILGFKLKTNFKQPYLSESIGEFWRRWHITLNTWLKDYVYIPLGGSRCSIEKCKFNVLLTFAISGLWHGANWGFIIWGLLNGIYVVAENGINRLKKVCTEVNKDYMENTPSFAKFLKFVRIIRNFVLISFSWLFFRAQELGVARVAVRRIFTKFNMMSCLEYIKGQILKGKGTLLYGLDVAFEWPKLLFCILIVIVVDILASKFDISDAISNGNRALRWAVYIALIVLVVVFGAYGFGYSASDFIYAAF